MKKRKIPTKAELLQLQKLYKTDEKIGERLGGVPSYLVAYWRRKKNIPKYSLPKFSETEIRNLWERYGDDEKAGLELGISRAAFYNWRRRYGFREKPAFLKLEQLELNFPGIALPSQTNSLYGQRSMAQKILARVIEADRVEVGEDVKVEPDLAVTAAGAADVIRLFQKGSDLVWNPGKILLLLGAESSADPDRLAARHQIVREFARRQNIKAFYDLREGACGQLALENGHILPGRLVVGLGRATMAYGAMACLAGIINPDGMANVWGGAGQKLTVPETARIVLTGRRSRGVYASDVALHIIRQLVSDDLSGCVIEYAGSVISQLSIGERFALSVLSSHTGAGAAICTYDATTRRYLTGRAMTRYQPVVPDKDAQYGRLYQINIDQLVPQITSLKELADVHPVAELQDLPVQQIILGSCTTGRFEDLRVAAEILKNNQVHDGCRLLIIPGSRTVYLEALKKGLIRVFIEAGAIVVHPGGYPSVLDLSELLAEGERCLTTTEVANAGETEAYLCSPATAAASALNAAITDPTRYGR